MLSSSDIVGVSLTCSLDSTTSLDDIIIDTSSDEIIGVLLISSVLIFSLIDAELSIDEVLKRYIDHVNFMKN